MTKHRDHADDRQGAGNEVALTDGVHFVNRVFHGMFGSRLPVVGESGKDQSNFEGRQLNDLLDLVQHTNHEEMSTAGEALWSARDAISDAAEELNGHITAVDWHGESGSTFRDWGYELVKSTRALAKYAGNAGTQITVAGSGLASVKKSLPPRDTRTDKKTVHELPAHKRVKGDPDYDAAVQVEGHRQEAINQMTRLASFYSVAKNSLASHPVPTFREMPDVGVPKPQPGHERIDDNPGPGGADLGATRNVESTRTTHAKGDGVGNRRDGLQGHGKINELPDQHMGMEIDHVAPPSAPPAPTPDGPPLTPNQQGPHQNPNPPFTNPFPQNTGPTSKSRMFGKTPGPADRTASRESRTPGRGSTPPGRGQNNMMGRNPMNQSRTTGRGTTPGRTPTGRAISGGTPRPAAKPSKSPQAGAVRKGGVIGGRPSPGQKPGSASKGLRGTVIGGRKENGDRPGQPKGKLGQRGVIGAPNPPEERERQAPRRTPGAPEGVQGEPTRRTTGPKGERAGFTPGGSGLVRANEEPAHTREWYIEQRDEPDPRHHQDIERDQAPEPQHRPRHAPPTSD